MFPSREITVKNSLKRNEEMIFRLHYDGSVTIVHNGKNFPIRSKTRLDIIEHLMLSSDVE